MFIKQLFSEHVRSYRRAFQFSDLARRESGGFFEQGFRKDYHVKRTRGRMSCLSTDLRWRGSAARIYTGDSTLLLG